MNRFLILLTYLLLFLPLPSLAGEVVINAVGDVMLAGRWAPSLRAAGYNHSFEQVATILKQGDITIANLEAPIAEGGTEFREKKFRFRSEPAVAAALRGAGISLVTLANNHSMDFGSVALTETLGHLDRAGIAWIGAGENLTEARKMALYTINGTRVAFLGYSLTQPTEFFAGSSRPGTAPAYEKLVLADVAAARRQADHVIVSIHWGTEGLRHVQPYQRLLAHRIVDAGADVILGHHPHVVRGVERYHNSLIIYSLGNFTFASKSRTADSSMIVRLRLGDGQREAEILPLDILYRRVGFQPRPMTGDRADDFIRQLNLLSHPLGTTVEHRGGRYAIPF